MNDLNREKDELNDAELNTVTGGTFVDTLASVAAQVWTIITGPPKGVKGESYHQDHRGE